MARICAILGSIFIWMILTLTSVPFFILVLNIRLIVSRLVPYFNKKVDKIVSKKSSIFLNVNKKKEINMGLCFGLEGHVEIEQILNTFYSQVINRKDSKNLFLRPELQQFPVPICGYYFWKWDEAFNLKNHINQLQINPEWDQKTKTAQEILEVLEEKVLSRPWPQNQSPWEILVVHNFKDSPFYGSAVHQSPRATLLVFRAHHVMGDGTSLRELFQDLLRDPNEEVISEASKFPHTTQRIPAPGFWQCAYTYFFGPWDLLCSFQRCMIANQGVVTNEPKPSKYGRRFNIGVTPNIPIDLIKGIRRSQQVSFQAVLLTLFAKAYAQFIANADLTTPDKLICVSTRAVPRHPSWKMRNCVTWVISVVGFKLEGREGFKNVNGSLQREINSTGPDFSFEIGQLIGSIPTYIQCLVNKILDQKMDGFLCLSNVLIFPEDLCLNGIHKLNTAFAIVASEEGVNRLICINFGCKEGMRLVFQIDNSIVPPEKISAQVLAQYFMEELQFWSSETKV